MATKTDFKPGSEFVGGYMESQRAGQKAVNARFISNIVLPVTAAAIVVTIAAVMILRMESNMKAPTQKPAGISLRQ
jgi:hypothetical protein